MSCNNCKCNKCVKKPICGCPIQLGSECVRYNLNLRLNTLNINEGDNLQDILIKIEEFANNITINASPTRYMDGKVIFEAIGGETIVSIPDLVKLDANYFLVKNGQFDLEGSVNEYTVSNITRTINLTEPLESGDIIQFYYYKEV